MTGPLKKIVVAISGRGLNLAALVEASRESGFPAEIAGVVSDNPEARGLVFATSAGIPTRVIERKDFASRQDHDAAMHEAFMAMGADLVALAGYMRLFTPVVVERWLGRMVNIHPALLPAFKGLDTHQRAIDAGARIHGCTVHFVTLGMDDGPIIAQAAVPVLVSDTAETLSARVLKAELRLYPIALKLLAEGAVRMEGDRAVFGGGRMARRDTAMLLSPEFDAGPPNIEDLARFTP